MFEVRIMSANSAKTQSPWATRIVSLVDPVGRFAKLDLGLGGKQHREKFDDEEMPDPRRPDIVLPRQDHIERVLAFARKFTDEDKVIIHCHAGRCRSTAMALGVFIQAGMKPDAAIEHLFTIRPKALPNRLVLEHVENVLGIGDILRRRVDDWYAVHGFWWDWDDAKILATMDDYDFERGHSPDNVRLWA